jgi:ABC-type uncharacterized transport system ATPase subunit
MEMVADPSLLFLDEPTSGLGGSTYFYISAPLLAPFSQAAYFLAQIHPPRTRWWMR